MLGSMHLPSPLAAQSLGPAALGSFPMVGSSSAAPERSEGFDLRCRRRIHSSCGGRVLAYEVRPHPAPGTVHELEGSRS